MKALAALAEVSLLKHDPFEDGTPAVTVHRLVQAVARARSEAKGLGAGRGRATDCTACGDLPIGRVLRPMRNPGQLCAHLTAASCGAKVIEKVIEKRSTPSMPTWLGT